MNEEKETLQFKGEMLEGNNIQLSEEATILNEQKTKLETQLEELQKQEAEETKTDNKKAETSEGAKAEVKKQNKEVVENEDGTTDVIITDPETGKTRTLHKDANGKIQSAVVTDENTGNSVEYDGKGNTNITVKAGESGQSGQSIYNKFYVGDDNTDNKTALIEKFKKQVKSINGEAISADYVPTDSQLQNFFFQKAGFTPDGKRMKDGGVLQAG